MKVEEKRTSIYDFQRHSKNPYTEKFVKKLTVDKRTRVTKFIKKANATVTNSDGEIIDQGDLLIGQQQIVDKEQFVKIYVGTLMIFNDLSKQAALLFTIILRLLQKNSTKVFLVPVEIIKWMRVGSSTYYRAIVELLDADMLARSDSSSIIYYINPSFLFNGNRMTIIQSFEKDKDSTEPSTELDNLDKDHLISTIPNTRFDNDGPEKLGGALLDETVED